MERQRWRFGTELYRETGDDDLGLPPVVGRDHHLPGRLKDLGYQQAGGNRFARTVSGIPVRVAGAQKSPQQAIIDVLIPAYTSRARENDHGSAEGLAWPVAILVSGSVPIQYNTDLLLTRQ